MNLNQEERDMRKRFIHLMIPVLALAMIAFLASACGGGTDEEDDATSDADVSDADDATADPDIADVDGEGEVPPPDEICDNDEDDDGDTLVDCDDPDCDGDPACPEGEDICDDEIDNDDDTLVDCDDPDCDDDPACAELCNGEDDDGDTLIDENPTDATIGDECYDGPPDLAGIGQCEYGAIECFGGVLMCIGWVPPLDIELCDGIDNDCDGEVPASEATEGCGTTIIPGDETRIEFMTAVRDVDVHINMDTTGSMGDELDTLKGALSTTIVPAIREVLPTSEFGVSTFDDFPLGEFGSAEDEDLPFNLHQRITSNVPMAQAALDAIALHYGVDTPESGIEALYQIATGAGTSWPFGGEESCMEPLPGGRNVTTGVINPGGDIDAYSISLPAGVSMRVDIDADDVGSDDLDPYLDIIAADGTWLAGNDDDACGYDSLVNFSTEGAIDVVILMSGLGSDDTGFYAMHVFIDGIEFIGQGDDCSDLEVGGDPFDPGPAVNPDLTVPLVDASTVFPRSGAAACTTDCTTELADADAEGWIANFCEGAPEDTGCGDGILGDDEECDDGNTDDGDGCDSDCNLELMTVPAFDWTDGFDPGLGHGSIGGVGFRPGAMPIIVHITDAVSHESSDYDGWDCDAHSSTETFDTLENLGARIVGVHNGAYSDDPEDLLYPLGMVMATDSVVPLCAFEGSDARDAGVCLDTQCCTGISGAGVAPISEDTCPLVFEIDWDGTGLDTSIVNAIDVLTQFVSYDLTADLRDDESDDINALCFIRSVGIVSFTGPTGSCTVTPEAVDTDDDTIDDTLTSATARTRVMFSILATNQDVDDVDDDGDTEELCADTGTYGFFIDVVVEGGTVVSSRRLEVEVPEG